VPFSLAVVRKKTKDILAPLSPRERLILSGLIIFGVVLLLNRSLIATNGDVGSLFRVPAQQCAADTGWVSSEQVSGQPSLTSTSAKSDFNNSNSAGWNGEAGQMSCIGFNAGSENVRAKSSLGFSIAAWEDSNSSGSTESAESNASTNIDSGLSLNQASTEPMRIESRSEPVTPNLYGQEIGTSLEGLLVVSVSNDGGATWTPLQTIDRSLLASDKTELSIALPDSFASDLSKFAVKVDPVVSSSENLNIWIDSIFVDYEVAESQDLKMAIIDSEGNKIEEPVPLIEPDNEINVELTSKDPDAGLLQGVSNRLDGIVTTNEAPKVTVKTEIVNSGGAVIAAESTDPEYQGKKVSSNDVWTFSAKLPTDTQPGKYTIAAEITDENGATQRIAQDFYWGVLALNSDKTIYRPDEVANFAITTLDEAGATVCDGNITLEITGPDQEASYSTDAGTIKKNDNCQVYSEDFTPDYQTSHQLGRDGKYTLHLKAKTANGEFELTDTIEVRSNQPAYITRTGPTRVYPPVEYPMRLEIKAEQDFKGTVQEAVPSSFELTDETDFARGYDKVEIKDSFKYITWDVDIKAGETVVLGYDFKAPPVSPAFYLFGPAKMISDGNTITEEIRQWQIAGDAVGDIAIYREATGTEVIGTALSNQTFDTTVSQGSGFSIAAGRDAVTLTDGGHYLVSYNLGLATLAGTNRSEINALIDVNGTNIAYGRSSCYIRRTGGVNNCWLSGSAIIEASAGNTVTIEAQRTDSNTATVQRRANESGLTIVKLDDSWDYARVQEAGGGQTFNAAGYATVSLDTNDELDTGTFSRTDGDITLADAGHYLVTTNQMHRNSNATGTRNNATRLTLDGTEIVGTRTTAYTIGTNSAQDSVAGFSGIIETSAANQVLRLQGACDGETCNSITNVGGQTGITIVKLPDNADYVRLYEVGGGQVVDTTAALTWDTQQEVDAASFTHSTVTNSERVIAEQDGNYLFFTSFYASRPASVSTAQLQPHVQFRDTGTTQQYGSTAAYNMGDNGTQGTFTSGNSSTFLSILSDNDYVDILNTDRSTRADANVTYQANRYAVQGVRVQSLFPSLSAETRQTHFRWRDNTTALNTSSGWLAAEDAPVNVSAQFSNQVRLRLEVANVGESAEVAARTYELQFGDATNLAGCSAVSAWTGVGDAADEFDMNATTHITGDGQSVTPGLLANVEGYTYLSGQAQETNDTTGTIGPMMMNRYTELEYSLSITGSAIAGHNYCFRAFDTTSGQVLDGYDSFPELTVNTVDSNVTSGLGEAGTFSSLADGAWSTVNFEGSYTTPVVVGTTNSHNGESALVFESRNVTSTSAEMRVCESQGGSSTGCDSHTSETVGYLVVDAAEVNNYDGIEAGTFSVGGSVDSSTSNISYTEAFAANPYVFGSVQSVNGDSPTEVRVTTTSTGGFTAGICQQNATDSCNGSHPSETVGWIAIEPGNTPFTNVNETGIDAIANSAWTAQTFTETFAQAPVVIAESQDIGDPDDSVIEEARSITAAGFDLRFCEMDTLDTCDPVHSAEDVAWFAIEPGLFTRIGNFDLDGYRIYDNEDSVQPVDALAAENSAPSNVANRDIIRIRTSIQAGGSNINANSFSLKLQYAQASSCASAGSWTDVGSATSSAIWRGYNNATPNNGDNISSNLLTNSDNTQSYVEQNNSPH
jgi:hypothetical protein